MSTPLPPVRRIVTGIDANGRSDAEDRGLAGDATIAARPDYRNNNIWRTVGSPAPLDAADSALEQRGVLPPQGGTAIRVIDIPPKEKDPELRKRQTEGVRPRSSRMRRRFVACARHPGMHVTDTIDYAIVLHGELVAIMHEGETVMRAGDILIQRGTNHAWANRSGAVARIAFILVDGRR